MNRKILHNMMYTAIKMCVAPVVSLHLEKTNQFSGKWDMKNEQEITRHLGRGNHLNTSMERRWHGEPCCN